ncbi:hypothetical protein [Georgenia sp. Z1491]|uniref:hypothetical protein n=1 Tax=Georgenia sp. Z1491 TaxID=3416707 RepID=UPI003CEAB901
MTDNPTTDGSRTSADEELAAARRRALLPTSSPDRFQPRPGPEETGAPAAEVDDDAATERDATERDATERDATERDATTERDAAAEHAAGTDGREPERTEAAPAEPDPADRAHADDVDTVVVADDADPAAPHGATGSGARAARPDDTSVTAPPPPTGEETAEDEVDAESWDAAFASGGDGVPTAAEHPADAPDTDPQTADARDADAHSADTDGAPSSGTTTDGAPTTTTAPTTTAAPADDEDDEAWTPLFAASRAAAARSAGSADAAQGHAPDSAVPTTTTPDAPGSDGTATTRLAAGGAARSGRGGSTPESRAAASTAGATAAGTTAAGTAAGSTTTGRKDQGLPDTWDGDAPQDAPPSRGAGTHVWVLLVSLVLAPVAWYLVADAGARLSNGESTAWVTGDVVAEHVAELGAGAVLVLLLVLLARVSSLGAWVWGIVGTVLGAAWLVVPGPLSDLLDPVLDGLTNLSGVESLGENIAAHLVTDGTSGRLLMYGLALLGVAIATHGARRAGRAEGVFVAEERRATRPRG